MDLPHLPEIQCRNDMAIDLVVSVINKAQEKLGIRQTLGQIARSRNILATHAIVSLNGLKPPLAITCEKLIAEAIEKTWNLTETFSYYLKYLEATTNECSQFFYYEAIFSQPTAPYPIPQATASVFFTVEDKQIEPPASKGVPLMVFRVEGHCTNHDVRYVKLIPDWVLEVLQMKIKFFKRIEKIRIF